MLIDAGIKAQEGSVDCPVCARSNDPLEGAVEDVPQVAKLSIPTSSEVGMSDKGRRHPE